MKIDEMQAGREMDCLIAEYVLNWGKDTPINVSNNHGYYQSKKLLNYSADIAAAWEVINWVKEWQISIDWLGDEWQAVFKTEDDGEHYSLAPSAPLAICRAALKAILQKEEI